MITLRPWSLVCSLVCAVGLFTGTASLPQPAAAAVDQKALISLARAAVEAEVKGMRPPTTSHQSPSRPVFVTIETKGRLRGCRGSLECRTASLEQEIILAARAAAAHDPRYRPLEPKDLRNFEVTVTIVERMEKLDSIDSLRPEDGLVLKAGNRVGVVLPWEGKDPKVRLRWAYKKAGVAEGAPCLLYRMEAERIRG